MNKLLSLGPEEVADSGKEVCILLKAIMGDSEFSEIRKGMAVSSEVLGTRLFQWAINSQ